MSDSSASALLTFVLALQGVSLIVLALFAPLAIGILINNTKLAIEALEQRVLLTRILHRWYLFLAFVALLVAPFFAPLVFEPLEHGVISLKLWWLPTVSFALWGLTFVPLLIWGIAIVYFLKLLNKLYSWLSNKDQIIVDYFKQPLRVSRWRKWFKSGVELNEKVKSWGYLWSKDLTKDDYLAKEEVRLFSYFTRDIDRLIKTTDDSELLQLARMTSMLGTEKRSQAITIDRNFSHRILEWHFLIWEKWFKNISNPYRNLSGDALISRDNICLDLRKPIRELMNAYFAGRNVLLYFQFDNLQKHITKYGEELSDSSGYYIDQFEDVFDTILAAVRSSGGVLYNIPDILKVTIQNYANEPVSRISWKSLRKWLEVRLRSGYNLPFSEKDEFKGLDNALHAYFTEIDINVWAGILTLVFSWQQVTIKLDSPPDVRYSDFSGDERHNPSESIEQQQTADFNRTIELADYLLSSEIAKNLDAWERELNTIEVDKRNWWRAIFNSLRKVAAERRAAEQRIFGRRSSDSADEQAASSAQQTD